MKKGSAFTTLAHSDFLLMHGGVTEIHEKWPVLKSRGACTGFDRDGRPVSSWGTDVPQFKIRFGKMAYKLGDGGIHNLHNTFIVEVHYDEAMDFHRRQMTHPFGSFSAMTCFDFSERAMVAMRDFLLRHKMRLVSEQLHIPFVRVVAEMALV